MAIPAGQNSTASATHASAKTRKTYAGVLILEWGGTWMVDRYSGLASEGESVHDRPKKRV